MAESLLANELTISFRTDEQLAGAHQDAINRNQRRCLIRDFREVFMSEVRWGGECLGGSCVDAATRMSRNLA